MCTFPLYMLVTHSYFFSCSHSQFHRVRHHIQCLSADGGEPPSQSEVTSLRERTVRGPTVLCTDTELLSGTGCCDLLHDNHSTCKSPQAHFTVSGKNTKKTKKNNNITLSSKANMYFDVFIRRGQLYHGLEMYDESTEAKKRGQRHVMLTTFLPFHSRPVG